MRAVLDASPTAALLVTSDGMILHANRAAKLMWGVDDFTNCDATSISTYISFDTDDSHQADGFSTWENIIDPNSFADDISAVNGVGMRGDNESFAVSITLARISVNEVRSVGSTLADRRSNIVDQYLYCMYFQYSTISRRTSFEKEYKRMPVTVTNGGKEETNNFNTKSFSQACEVDIILGIFDASFNAMFVINEQCDIQMVNEKSSEVFGWSREEFIGQNINIIMTKDVAASHDKYVKDYLKTGIKKMIGTQREVTACRKDGTTFPAALGLAEPKGQSGLICGFIRDLTAEKAAQAEINREQMLNAGIIDASFDGLFVISDHGIIERVNQASCDLFGWSEVEFVGQNIKMIMPQEHAEKHDTYLSHYMSTRVRRMIGQKRELEACRKNGSRFPCILGLKEVVTNGCTQFVGFVRDITVEKEALGAVKAEQNLLSKILDASFDSLLVINEKGILQLVNEAATKTFGWSRQEFIGRNINMIMPPLHAAKHDSYLEKYIATGFKKMIGKQREVESLRKDGTTFPCTLGLAEVTHNGSRLFVGFVRDVSVQKALMVANAQREASDSLLYNILPVHIANRLKQDPSHIADHYDNTTILFADIVGFTDRTSKMTPHDGKINHYC
jgi:PAS domain S-box-containing protein